jgi:hypothetical protein
MTPSPSQFVTSIFPDASSLSLDFISIYIPFRDELHLFLSCLWLSVLRLVAVICVVKETT